MIRQTTLQDISIVQQIARLSRNATYKHIIPDYVQDIILEKTYSSMMLAKQLEKSIFLMAEYNNKPIGFASFTRVDEDGDAELTAIYILPEYQKLGFGKQLIEAGLSKMTNGKQLFVYIESDNLNARLFCEEFGFELLEEFYEYLEDHLISTSKYVYLLKTPVF